MVMMVMTLILALCLSFGAVLLLSKKLLTEV